MFQEDLRRLGWLCIGLGIALVLVGLVFAFVGAFLGGEEERVLGTLLRTFLLFGGALGVVLLPAGLLLLRRAPKAPRANP